MLLASLVLVFHSFSDKHCYKSISVILISSVIKPGKFSHQPSQQKILVAKGAVAPRAAYEPVSARLIEVASGGATAILRSSEEYAQARKTLYEWQ